jgi:hypothetical protein
MKGGTLTSRGWDYEDMKTFIHRFFVFIIVIFIEIQHRIIIHFLALDMIFNIIFGRKIFDITEFEYNFPDIHLGYSLKLFSIKEIIFEVCNS